MLLLTVTVFTKALYLKQISILCNNLGMLMYMIQLEEECREREESRCWSIVGYKRVIILNYARARTHTHMLIKTNDYLPSKPSFYFLNSA